MGIYISILRGINVSGQKKINMNDLKTLYGELNFKNIKTYIQSGNVIFENESSDLTDLSKQIKQKISEKYNFDVPVIIRTDDEIERVLSSNPFIKEDNTDKLHVTFLSEEPNQANIDKIKNLNYEPDKFTISGKEVYLYCPNGYGNTKLSNNFFENKLKVKSTTRNWRTVNELSKIGKNRS